MSANMDAQIVVLNLDSAGNNDIVTVLNNDKFITQEMLQTDFTNSNINENEVQFNKASDMALAKSGPLKTAGVKSSLAKKPNYSRKAKKIPVRGPQFWKRMLINMLCGPKLNVFEVLEQNESEPGKSNKKATTFAQRQAVKKIINLFKLVEKQLSAKEAHSKAVTGAPQTSPDAGSAQNMVMSTGSDSAQFSDIFVQSNVAMNTNIPQTSAATNNVGALPKTPMKTTTGSIIEAILSHSLADSPQDMDLIDILWKQDMDLGVGREVFDGNLRREMEKQRELELQKQNASVEQKVVPPPQAMNFTVDSETGEMIPQPAGPTPQDPQLPPAANNAGQFLINNAPVETVPPQNANLNLDQNFQIFDRQNSFEERWADVENILNITPNTTEPDAGTPPEHALLRNATLMSTNASDAAQIGLLGNNTGFDFNNTDFMNQMNNNTTLFNMDNQSLVFNNASQILQNATLNNTNFNNQSLLDELLREDFDLDTIDLDQAEMKLECDSAMGSSVAGSVSPVASMNDSSSNSTSYDGMEGATGGSHDNKLTLKEEPFDPSYKYSDFTEYSDDHMRLNSSGFSDDGAMELETAGDPAQVAHNHTYVLQPGQRPRERKQTPEEKQALAQMSRDEKKAKNMKIPISMDDIVNSPVEEFNEILQRYKLSDAQLNLIRDIRRRGKNKVAAQNCRKRKMEVINSLEDEVNAIRRERDRLQREKHQVNKQANEMKRKYDHLYEEVFRSLRDDNGQPYDPSQYSLQQTPDGNVFLVPVNSTSPARDHEEKHTHKRKGKKGGH